MGKNRFVLLESNMRAFTKSEVRKLEAVTVNGRLSLMVSFGNLYSYISDCPEATTKKKSLNR